MKTVTTVYDEIGYTCKKSGKCPVCGKPVTRTRKFYQTINPFNKNSKGKIKDRDEILRECQEKSKRWKQLPAHHAKCEPRGYWREEYEFVNGEKPE